MCWVNVQKRIKAMGGKVVFGWAVVRDVFTLVKQSHCVWEDHAGQLWDVTPVFESVSGQYAVIGWPEYTEFERDDSVTFEEKSLPTRYMSLHPSPHVATACAYMERADEFLRKGDLDKCRYWTERANREMAKARLRGRWYTPASIAVSDVLASMMNRPSVTRSPK